MTLCLCGCQRPATHGDWIRGHWNRGKRFETRAAPGTRVVVEKTEEQKYANRVAGQRLRFGPKKEPVFKPCECGCGTSVKGRLVRGHAARINNPSWRPEVKTKQKAAMARRISSGEELWGGVNNKRGANHHSWKGGTSSLQKRARAGLYRIWSRPILKRDGFRCQKCGVHNNDLVVHHDTVRFATVIQTVLIGRDLSLMSFEEQGEVCQQIIQYHLDNTVTGITLCRPCHKNVHELDPDIDD